ncbi:DUF4349 domain-containing protein [Streptomyces sp. GMY02]|uniref:DUF4349 domain-containing protein n=1 Tax=Streptomyces sp. GMY02 TaxID=1333528 RepID=UPI001C2BA690|nr:DUF4349 domain-containing protein [Streptomyces sp. GMY02]QXE34162.1 DUF4349 domain-containing protein [Streptomyces sp. GMY02]
MRRMPAFAAALLVISLALAGCGAGSDDNAGSDAAKAVPAQQDGQEGAAGAGAADRAAEAPGSEGQPTTAPSRAGTHVIRTAELTVRVKDTQKALTVARTAAEDAGGVVEDESTERTEDAYVTSRIVLRVPQDAYDSVLAELAGTGTLLARKANAKDVTDQVVDVNSRIASQRVSVERIRELMDRATTLGDVVTLEAELSTRQAALESLLAQQASLKDRTTLATITLELSEAPVVKPAEKEEDPGFLDALAGGWDAFTATVRWIAVVLGAVAPFVGAVAVLYGLWRLARRLLPTTTGAHGGRTTVAPGLPATGRPGPVADGAAAVPAGHAAPAAPAGPAAPAAPEGHRPAGPAGPPAGPPPRRGPED